MPSSAWLVGAAAALGALYLAIGVLLATAHSWLDRGTRGSGPALELGDIVRWTLLAVGWLPYGAAKAVWYSLLLVLPVSWTRR